MEGVWGLAIKPPELRLGVVLVSLFVALGGFDTLVLVFCCSLWQLLV